jgi:hypothetical protein
MHKPPKVATCTMAQVCRSGETGTVAKARKGGDLVGMQKEYRQS